MPEEQQAVAVAVGDSPRGCHVDVSLHERDADGRAGHKGSALSQWVRVRAGPGAAPRHDIKVERSECVLEPGDAAGIHAADCERHIQHAIGGLLARGLHLFSHLRRSCTQAGRFGGKVGAPGVEHGLDRGRKADGVPGKVIAQGDRPDQPTADIDRAAAHAVCDPQGTGDRRAVGSPEHDIVFAFVKLGDDPEYLNPELGDLRTLKDCQSIAAHAGPQLTDMHKLFGVPFEPLAWGRMRNRDSRAGVGDLCGGHAGRQCSGKGETGG